MRAVPRGVSGEPAGTYEARDGVDRQPLLQLPYAVYVVRPVESLTEPSDQLPHRGRQPPDRSAERLQPVPSRQDIGMDIRVSRKLVRHAEGKVERRRAERCRIGALVAAGRCRTARPRGLEPGVVARAAGLWHQLDAALSVDPSERLVPRRAI